MWMKGHTIFIGGCGCAFFFIYPSPRPPASLYRPGLGTIAYRTTAGRVSERSYCASLLFSTCIAKGNYLFYAAITARCVFFQWFFD